MLRMIDKTGESIEKQLAHRRIHAEIRQSPIKKTVQRRMQDTAPLYG
ncbi:hypothetical protein [Salibacterium halotolerans]|nr:hypothetical protein [Salibacterium halotolerans]